MPLAAAALAIALATAPVAVFGLAQLAHTAAAQLSGPGEVTDFLAISSGPRLLLSDPGRLYAPGAVAELERSVSHTDRFDRPFSFLPHAAALLAPLAWLPYGVAYLAWLGLGLAALALSMGLLAPGFRRAWWLLGVLFLPAQLALIMGQTSALALLAVCGLVRLIERRPRLAWLLVGLSPATWKPQLLLPAFGVALAAARAWRALAWLLGPPAVMSGVVVALAGPHLLTDYRAQAASMSSEVLAGSSVETAGQTLLGLAQAVVGPTPAALGLAMFGGLVAGLVVALVWRHGLRSDARRDLQLAVLPLAGVLAAPHALAYDLLLWLPSVWLLLRYVEHRPTVRGLSLAAGLAVWASANVAVLTGNQPGFPWAVPAGLALLACLTWLYASHPEQP